MVQGPKDPGVAVVVGALLLSVILITIFSAYLLFYVPLTGETNSMNAITTEQNDLISLAQKLNNPPYAGISISHSIQLGYAGVPPFSQATPTTVSFFDNSSYFKGYLNYTFNVTLTNSTFAVPISSGTLAFLPINIVSNVSQSPSGYFNQRIVIDSYAYQTYEAANLTNIFFMYQNGTVIPSWLENNNSNASLATTYWLKLDMSGTEETIYMVFLSPTINVMNSYQTGEAPSLSPYYGQYDDGSYVFPLYFNGNAPLSDFNISSAYSLAHSTVTFGNGSRTINALNISTGTKAAVYVPLVYTADSVSASDNWIEETSFGTGDLNGNSGILGLGSTTNQSSYGTGGNGVSGTYAIGMYADSSSLYVANETDGVISGTSFGSISGTQSWFYGELVYSPGNNSPGNSFTVYSEQQLYAHNQTATYGNGIQGSSSLYVAPIISQTGISEKSYYYYYNWIRIRTPPAEDEMPVATLGNISTSAVPMLPISLINHETAGTGSYVQPISLNSLKYQIYESRNLSNIFFMYANGTVIPSWLENGNTNTSQNSTYWLSLYSITPLSNNTIYAVFLPTFMNALNNFRTGEAPNLSTIYGQYDDGWSVFSYYNSGTHTLPLTNTGTGGTGPMTTTTAPSPWNYSLVGSVSSGGSSATTWTTAGLNNSSSPGLNLTSSYAVQAMVYLGGSEAKLGILTNVQNISNGPFYVFGVNATTSGNDVVGYYPAGSTGTIALGMTASSLTSSSWYQLTALDVNDNLSLYSSSTFALNDYGFSEITQTPGNGYTGGGIAVTTLGSTSTDYWTMIIERALPLNGIFPNVTIGSLNPGLASPNILPFSSSVQMNGTFSALTSLSRTGISGIYLSNGVVILKSGTQSIAGGTLPLNISSNSSGYGFALNAVSMQGSNISASGYGASTITLANIQSYSVNYQKNQYVHFVSGTQIPYTAVVANISITKFSYTIVGNLSNAFNSTLYQKYGTGQAVGGEWFLMGGKLIASSTGDRFTISMNTTASLELNAISVNYNSYILEDI